MIPTLFRPRPAGAAQDAGLLLLRAVLGVVLVAHGWQKLVDQGFGPTADGFGAMGIPAPEAAAAYAIAVELGGGVLLLLGALTPLVGLLVAGNMAGALWFVHRDAFFATDGGYEFVLTLGVAGLALAALGSGRWSVDRALFGPESGAAAPAEQREAQPAGAHVSR
ncbi:DoxX family protein [Nocardioides litoris]|uniref:DoxX family protein n=1 Tax=Nocardioides litoris TaxID=1926648 RepID=UPI0011222695|nr:DoxX family protein [Nocardioides litoris]